MLYTIVITLCLIGNRADCQTYTQPATELSPNPSQAFVEAQALVATWMEDHPGQVIARWRLMPGRGA